MITKRVKTLQLYLDTQIAVDNVEADEQACDNDRLIVQHQCVRLKILFQCIFTVFQQDPHVVSEPFLHQRQTQPSASAAHGGS